MSCQAPPSGYDSHGPPGSTRGLTRHAEVAPEKVVVPTVLANSWKVVALTVLTAAQKVVVLTVLPPMALLKAELCTIVSWKILANCQRNPIGF